MRATACLYPLLFIAVFLAGCSTATRPPAAPTTWEQHTQRLQSLEQWTAIGKVAVRDSDSADTANFVWQQREQSATVELSGPLGTGATRLSSDGHTLMIDRGGEVRTVDIRSAEAVERETGWHLPLQALPFWMKGATYPESEVQMLSTDPDNGRLVSLNQDGWEVSVEQYGVFDGFALPTRLRIHSGDTRATVLIRRWQTGP